MYLWFNDSTPAIATLTSPRPQAKSHDLHRENRPKEKSVQFRNCCENATQVVAQRIDIFAVGKSWKAITTIVRNGSGIPVTASFGQNVGGPNKVITLTRLYQWSARDQQADSAGRTAHGSETPRHNAKRSREVPIERGTASNTLPRRTEHPQKVSRSQQNTPNRLRGQHAGNTGPDSRLKSAITIRCPAPPGPSQANTRPHAPPDFPERGHPKSLRGYQPREGYSLNPSSLSPRLRR